MEQWSGTIDAGLGYAEDGMGTCPDRPDLGTLDIGCHFPLGIVGSFGFPSCPADFNWDGIVDELDLELMEACMGATNDPNYVQLDVDLCLAQIQMISDNQSCLPATDKSSGY